MAAFGSSAPTPLSGHSFSCSPSPNMQRLEPLKLPTFFAHGSYKATLTSASLLGEGAYSLVYRGVDKDDAPVALKFIDMRREVARATYCAERDAARRLQEQGAYSLHLGGVIAALRLGPIGVLVLPLLTPRTLETAIEARAAKVPPLPFSVAEVLAIAGQLAHAVGLMHRHGVAHRDIKAENIAYSAVRSPCITLFDFGLADRSVDERQPGAQLLTSRAVGSPIYMAPECFQEGAHFDAYAADMWSVGQTLFHVICLRVQFDTVRRMEDLRWLLSTRRPKACDAPEVAREPAYAQLLARTLVYSPASERARAAELEDLVTSCEQALF